MATCGVSREGICSFFVVFLFLSGCGGSGGGGNNGVGSKLTTPTLTLSTPSAKPLVVPPSTGPDPTPVTFLALISGSAYPPDVLNLDEVDSHGKVVQAAVAQLRDDGELEDAQLGDRVYTGVLEITSALSAERNYRVSTTYQGKTVVSGSMNLWISGCPASSRPSNPDLAVYDSSSNSVIFSNEMLIRTAETVVPDVDQINTLLSGIGGSVVGCVPAQRQYLVEFNNTTADAIGVYTAIDTVKSGAPSQIISAVPNIQALVSPQALPDVSLLCNGSITVGCQWYLDRIRAPLAWQIAGGGDPQRGVAVIDFGVDCSLDNLPCDPILYNNDPIDHGTGVAGLIAAPNTGSGMAGLSYDTALYPHSVIAGSGSQYKLSELINAATSQDDVRVINISGVVSIDFDGQLQKAVCNAIDRGRLVVTAAGNAVGPDATTCQVTNVYPARFSDGTFSCSNGADLKHGLIVVGATDINDNLASWQDSTQSACSNQKYVDIYAPGKDVVTLSTQFGYTTKSGTSYATPLVSATAALVWTANPGFSPAQIRDRLLGSAGMFNLTSSSAAIQSPNGRMLDVYRAAGGLDSVTQPDTSPDPITIPDTNDAPLLSYVTSDPVAVTGVDSSTPVHVQDGYYQINDGPFTSAAGRVHKGDRIRVRLRSADTEDALKTARLDVGDRQQQYTVKTRALRTLPDRDDFPAQRNVPRGNYALSPVRTYTGLSMSPVYIENGEYSIDNAAFTSGNSSQPDSIGPNDSIQVRVMSSNSWSSRRTAILHIGSVAIPFTADTPRVDIKPDSFYFTAQNGTIGIGPDIFAYSNPVTITGINADAPLSVSGGEYSTDSGESYTSAPGFIGAGQSIMVRLFTLPNNGDRATVTLTVGEISRDFSIMTNEYDVSGIVTGVYNVFGAGLELQSQVGESPAIPIPIMPVMGNEVADLGFNLPLYDGAPYDIQVVTSPPGYTCTVINGSGAITAATGSVSGVEVQCVPNVENRIAEIPEWHKHDTIKVCYIKWQYNEGPGCRVTTWPCLFSPLNLPPDLRASNTLISTAASWRAAYRQLLYRYKKQ